MTEMGATRGILDPGRMRTAITLTRVEPTGVLGPVDGMPGLVEIFWQTRWDLADDEFVQPLLTHPCANLSVGPRYTYTPGPPDPTLGAAVVGVLRRVDERRLTGRGFNAAAKLACGALGAFLPVPAHEVTDRIVPLGELIDPALVDVPRLVRALEERHEEPHQQFEVLAAAYGRVVESASPARVSAARECVAIAALAAGDRTLTSAAALAAAAGMPLRSLQRLFREHAGVSPLWVLRRHRLIDAAERARGGNRVRWADLAAELGYADQAHLTRDFTAAVGTSPAAYARSVTPLTD